MTDRELESASFHYHASNKIEFGQICSSSIRHAQIMIQWAHDSPSISQLKNNPKFLRSKIRFERFL